MWSSTLTDRSARRSAALALPLTCLALAACSQSGAATQPTEAATEVVVSKAVAAKTPAVPAEAASRILGKDDFTLRGKPACNIRFRYAGHEAETLFWEEPCKAVTAKLMDRAELEAAGKWDRLDEFARKFVAALPGGKVLYVGGSVSASVYPIGTTGATYDVPVAD